MTRDQEPNLRRWYRPSRLELLAIVAIVTALALLLVPASKQAASPAHRPPDTVQPQ
jgi:hypothetical protein